MAEKAEAKPKDEEEKESFQLPGYICGAVGIVMLSVVLYVNNFSASTAPAWGQELFAPHVVPPPAAKPNEVVVQFCQACGTGDIFKQLKKAISADPSNKLVVKPDEYPAPKLMSLISDFVGMSQIGIVLALFVRNKELPSTLRTNKVASVFGLWFGGSMVRSGLTKTNAFEVYLGQKLVWSSIAKAGEVPKLTDLVESFKAVGVTIKAEAKKEP